MPHCFHFAKKGDRSELIWLIPWTPYFQSKNPPGQILPMYHARPVLPAIHRISKEQIYQGKSDLTEITQTSLFRLLWRLSLPPLRQGFPLGLLDGGAHFSFQPPPPYRGAEIEMDGGYWGVISMPRILVKTKLFRVVDTQKKDDFSTCMNIYFEKLF